MSSRSLGDLTGATRLARAEDLVLAGWLLIILPALALVVGTAPLEVGGDLPPGVGLLYLLAAGGGLASLLTRTAGDPAPELRTEMTPREFARFPFMAAIGLFAEEGAQSLGLPFATALLPLALVAALIGWLIPGRLPALSLVVRRTLVMPIILVGSGVFEGLAGDVWAGITPGDIAAGLAGASSIDAGYVAFLLGLLVAGTLAFYVLLVFAPRQAIEAEGSWLAWAFSGSPSSS